MRKPWNLSRTHKEMADMAGVQSPFSLRISLPTGPVFHREE
jgi:hypothetical protein